MSILLSSSIQHVTTMPELIDAIFVHLSRADNACTALVCKQWLEISRDHIWYEVDRPTELFNLLSPLRLVDDPEDNTHEFVRIPRKSDWIFFEPFAHRVRRLPWPGPPYHVSDHMAGALLRSITRPRIIFPNLEYMDWNVGGPLMLGWESLHILFLHPGVRRVGLHALVPGNANSEFGSLSEVAAEIAELSPHLTRLEASTTTREVANLDGSLVPLLSLASLAHVGLCQSLLTPVTLETLSLLPNLHTLFAIDPDASQEHLHFDPATATDFSRPLVLADGAFGALRRIHLVMPTMSISNLLDDPCFPAARLHELRVRVLDVPTLEITASLISTISTRCLHMQDLMLILYPPDFVERLTTEQNLSPLTAAVLTPLRVLTKLNAIYIYHIIPVSLSDEELLHLLEALPLLTQLFLVPRPDYWPNPPDQPPTPCFNWQTLALVAQRHAHMKRLGLYIDLTGPPPTTIPARFPALEILEVGTSPCPSVPRHVRAKLASALCSILSSRTVLGSGILKISAWSVNPPVYVNAPTEMYLEQWTEVRTLVHFGLGLLAGTQREDIFED